MLALSVHIEDVSVDDVSFYLSCYGKILTTDSIICPHEASIRGGMEAHFKVLICAVGEHHYFAGDGDRDNFFGDTRVRRSAYQHPLTRVNAVKGIPRSVRRSANGDANDAA